MTDWQITSPRIAALRILEQRFGDAGASLLGDAGGDLFADPASAPTWKLSDWQAEAVSRAEHIVRRRGGVLIADSVGLGKTHIGAALIERARKRDLICAVIAPTSLRQHWRRTLRADAAGSADRKSGVRFLTHAQLSRSHGAALAADVQFVVIDEAHAFRTRHTRRYRALHPLRGCASFVLLTATPVNNAHDDLLNLLLLFARDDAFRDIGIASLRSAFRAGEARAIARVLAETTIRRTRAFVRRNYSAIVDYRGRTLSFPDREDPVPIRYDLADIYRAAWPGALDAVQHLELAWLNTGTRELLRLNLLKRFESSTHAFIASLESLGGFVDALLGAMHDGRALSPAEYRRFFRGMTDQLVMRDVLLRSDRRDSVDSVSVIRDRDRIRALAALLSTDTDPKLEALRAALRAAIDDAPAVVFSGFRDTARYLWRALRNEFRTALIDGQDARLGAARASRASILRALSPGRRVHARERVDVLIATDVLSEGLDLHAARTVVSYDLPWNPIRIVQRVGRIDRPGSPHKTIRIVNFIPDRGLDRLLDLLQRIRAKLDAIRTTIGLDAPVLDRNDVDADALRTVLHRLADGDSVLDDDRTDVLAISDALYLQWRHARGELHHACGDSNIVAAVDGDVSVLARAGRVFVVTGSRVAEAWETASEILLRALGDARVRDVRPDRVGSTLRHALDHHAILDTALASPPLAAHAGRTLLAFASRLTRPADLVRVEALVRRLQAPLPQPADRALELLLTDPPADADELLAALETAVAPEAKEPVHGPWILLLGEAAESVDRAGEIG